MNYDPYKHLSDTKANIATQLKVIRDKLGNSNFATELETNLHSMLDNIPVALQDPGEAYGMPSDPNKNYEKDLNTYQKTLVDTGKKMGDIIQKINGCAEMTAALPATEDRKIDVSSLAKLAEGSAILLGPSFSSQDSDDFTQHEHNIKHLQLPEPLENAILNNSSIDKTSNTSDEKLDIVLKSCDDQLKQFKKEESASLIASAASPHEEYKERMAKRRGKLYGNPGMSEMTGTSTAPTTPTSSAASSQSENSVTPTFRRP